MPQMINLPQMNFFIEKQLIKFSCTYYLVSFCKILKNSYSQSRVMGMCHFQTQNGKFVLNKFFLVQTITLIHLLALFIAQNL